MSHRNQLRITVAIVWSLAGLAACGGADDAEPVAEAASTSAGRPVELISAAEAAELSDDPAITVIDVRTPEEYAEGHLDGATLIDFYTATFADQIGELDRDGAYLVYCRSGNRSGQAVELMEQLGFEQVYDLNGGIQAWGANGSPLTTP